MNYWNWFILSAVGVLMLSLGSCSGTFKNADSADTESVFEVTSTDSAAVIDMCEDVLESMRRGDLEGASAKLYRVLPSTGSIEPIDDDGRRELEARSSVFPVKQYALKSIILDARDENTISYEVYFTEAADDGDAPKVIIAFNPIKREGKWYLTLKQQY